MKRTGTAPLTALPAAGETGVRKSAVSVTTSSVSDSAVVPPGVLETTRRK